MQGRQRRLNGRPPDGCAARTTQVVFVVDPREDPIAYVVDDALRYGARRIRLDSVPPLPTEIRIRFEQSDQRDHWTREVHKQGFTVEVDGACVAIVTIPRGFALPKW